MLVSRPIRRDPEEWPPSRQSRGSAPGWWIEVSSFGLQTGCHQGVQPRRGRQRGILTENSCDGLTSRGETRAAGRAILPTSHVAEGQRQGRGSVSTDRRGPARRGNSDSEADGLRGFERSALSLTIYSVRQPSSVGARIWARAVAAGGSVPSCAMTIRCGRKLGCCGGQGGKADMETEAR
jgi:hypothetical protein